MKNSSTNSTATRSFSVLDAEGTSQTLTVSAERGEDRQETEDNLLEAAQDEAERLFPDCNVDSLWEA